MFKKLTAGCIIALSSALSFANAQADICKEIEWWIVEGLTDTPFSSFDSDFKHLSQGRYRAGDSLPTHKNEDCLLSKNGDILDDRDWASLTCRLSTSGADTGRQEPIRATYNSTRDQLMRCSTLHEWKMSEFERDSDYSTSWHYPGGGYLTLQLRVTSRADLGATVLELAINRLMSPSNRFGSEPTLAEAGKTRPQASQNVLPKGAARWAKRIAGDYPEIAQRLGWEGTVGVRVIVGIDGKPIDCVVTSSSGWPILDHTACESMKRFARFDPAKDEDGNPEYGRYTTSIRYEFE